MPRATYRVQLTPQTGFDVLRGAVPALRELGISHLYLSPVLQSRPGSRHGYDITDHARLNDELGGQAGFHALSAACREHGLGLLLDFVPNHMAVLGVRNPWWWDVLENGPASRHAGYFDIDWNPARASMRNRLLVPVLAAPLGEVVDAGGIRVEFDERAGAFRFAYGEGTYPLEPGSYPMLFKGGGTHTGAAITDAAARQEFSSLLDAFAALPPPLPSPPETLELRERDIQVCQRRLARLCEREPGVRDFISATLDGVNEPAPELLARLLQAQPYRLAFWRVSGEEINYRRFFDVNELAALRMEEREVFNDTHGLLATLWRGDVIDGLRIDHADGLYDPSGYFRRLRDLLAEKPGRRPWIVAEKILAGGEPLPRDWAVDGTTGYEFGAQVTAWLLHGPGLEALDGTWRRFVGGGAEYAEILYHSKKLVMRTSLAAEVSMLAARLDRLAQLHRDTSDFTLFDLREAIVEVIASFPVYRTYIRGGLPDAGDAQQVRRAIGGAISRRQAAPRALEFLARVLLGELAADPVRAPPAAQFTQKFQQVTGPVTAKGAEDTAFYRYARCLAMNEVGADPDGREISTDALHRANEARARDWPRAMLSTCTHDSKRGEDARWRLCVLSEIPHRWAQCVGRWRRLKRRRKDAHEPSAVQEYLLLQALLGIWPADVRNVDVAALRPRLEEYAVKAAREAKEQTSWLEPDDQVEAALRELVGRMLPSGSAAGFERYFRDVMERVAFYGMLNSLSAVVLKATSPGIADFYQGTEGFALTLVDPDNRQPFEAGALVAGLADVRKAIGAGPSDAARQLLQRWQDGRLKLFVTATVLRLRETHEPAFSGDYLPLPATGRHADHICSYARSANDSDVVVAVSRWQAILAGDGIRMPGGEEDWGDTAVAVPGGIVAGIYVDVLCGQEHQVAPDAVLLARDLFAVLPCSVLVRRDAA